jgi:hypothetical protein
VNEVPHTVRSEHELLARLADRYGLRLTHFQSHYLPGGWEQRRRSLGRYGELLVYVVDTYDVLVSKLFSPREKDRDDLRVLAPRIDRSVLAERMRNSGGAFLGDASLRNHAVKNWYIVYGEPLPAD